MSQNIRFIYLVTTSSLDHQLWGLYACGTGVLHQWKISAGCVDPKKKKHQDKEKLECFFPRDGCTSNRLLENTPTIALNDSPSGTAIQKNRSVGTSWKWPYQVMYSK